MCSRKEWHSNEIGATNICKRIGFKRAKSFKVKNDYKATDMYLEGSYQCRGGEKSLFDCLDINPKDDISSNQSCQQLSAVWCSDFDDEYILDLKKEVGAQYEQKLAKEVSYTSTEGLCIDPVTKKFP